VNGFLVEGAYKNFSMVTNSADTSAKLVFGDGDVDGVINGLFSDGIEIEKIGEGMLVVSNATVRGKMTVKSGSVKFVGENSFSSQIVFEEGSTLLMVEESSDDSISKFNMMEQHGGEITGSPRIVLAKQSAGTTYAYAGSYLDEKVIVVDEGILQFTGTTSDKWWRFTVRKALNIGDLPGNLNESGQYEMNVMALWPTNVTSSYRVQKVAMENNKPWGTGRMLTFGLETNTMAFTSAMTSYSQLPANTCMLGFNESCRESKMEGSGRLYSGGADGLFSGINEVCIASTGSSITENDGSTWKHVVWRLGDDVPVAASYGLCKTAWSNGPWSWTLESSSDGENWTLRDNHVAEVNVAAMMEGVALEEAYALSEYPVVRSDLKSSAGCMMWYNNGIPYHFTRGGTAAERLQGVTAVVANGAILDTRYIADGSISFKALEVDCENGGGKITKFRPASNGTLFLTGIDGKLPWRYVVPITLSEVIDGDTFASWNVLVNGVPAQNSTLSWTNGALTIKTSKGAVIVVR
jgi:hypothetical protein